MTSPTNTAGLEVVAWEARLMPDGDWYPITLRYVEARQKDDAFDVRPLFVTAASAQARIAELEARVAELEATKWEAQHADTMNDLVAMGLARDDEKARADRLAKGLKDARDQFVTIGAESTDESVRLFARGCADSARAALQQEPTT